MEHSFLFPFLNPSGAPAGLRWGQTCKLLWDFFFAISFLNQFFRFFEQLNDRSQKFSSGRAIENAMINRKAQPDGRTHFKFATERKWPWSDPANRKDAAMARWNDGAKFIHPAIAKVGK